MSLPGVPSAAPAPGSVGEFGCSAVVARPLRQHGRSVPEWRAVTSHEHQLQLLEILESGNILVLVKNTQNNVILLELVVIIKITIEA